MRVVLLGDFHGVFSDKLFSKVRSLKPDLVLSTGDLPSTHEQRKLIFKYWDKLVAGADITDFVGRDKWVSLIKDSVKSMEFILRRLNSLGVPVVLIWGNSDYVSKEKIHGLLPLNARVKKFRNIRFVSRQRVFSFGSFQVLAFSGYRFPGEKGFYKDKLKDPVFRKRIDSMNSSWVSRLEKLFSRLDRSKKSVFLCHDPPRGLFDFVSLKNSPLFGKHIGDEFFRRFIKRFRPDFCVCGHMHENPGVDFLGKTKVINPGAVVDGRFAFLADDEVVLFRV